MPRKIIALGLLAVGVSCIYAGNATENADTTEGVIIVDRNVPGTVTAGIQEALDSLPKAGGVAVLPVGVYEIDARIYMKPDTILRGCGAGSVIRKSRGMRILLAEDVAASSTQRHVVVERAVGLRPGMDMSLGEMDGKAGFHGYIDRVEGNKVYLNQDGHRYGRRPSTPRPWKPSVDLKVKKQAALYNGFILVRTSLRNVISDLALDGNREEQKIDGEKLYRKYPSWGVRLRCVPYMGGDSRIENCRVYNAAGVAISLASRATVFNCDVSRSGQGIHPGAGPYSRIIMNTVHHNETEGIYMCWGNYGVIISQNHIYANGGSGIGQLGRPCPQQHPINQHMRSGDRFIVITDNIIYHNGRSAIQDSAIGKAEDYIITGNLIFNNFQKQDVFSRYNRNIPVVPAAISFFNARQCIIANNRIFDDQNLYPAGLKEAVSAGTTELKLEDWVKRQPMCLEPMDEKHYYAGTHSDCGLTDFVARIEGGGVSEIQRVTCKKAGADWVLTTDSPLLHDYEKGASITIEKTQSWGIYLGGAETEQNVVANNLCAGNAIGGILWTGREMAVNGNLGKIVELDSQKPIVYSDVVYPFCSDLNMPGLDSNRKNWSQNTKFEQSDRSDALMIKLENETADKYSEAVFNPEGNPEIFQMKPNKYYRISAWVKTEALRNGSLVLPHVFIRETRADKKIASIGYRKRTLDMMTGDQPEVTAGAWLRITGHGRTRGDAQFGQIYCQLDRGAVGAAWVEGITVQELDVGD